MSALDRARVDARNAAGTVARAELPIAGDEALAAVGLAQASATLALAEEQRTANLLALLVGVNSNGVLLPSKRVRDAVGNALTERLDLTGILTTYGDAS
jgi:hypothetical protein